MMSTEMHNAPTTEKAIPLCAEPLVLPSAMEEPRKRLKPMEVVPTRLRTRLELPGGMVGSRPWKNLQKRMPWLNRSCVSLAMLVWKSLKWVSSKTEQKAVQCINLTVPNKWIQISSS